MPIVVTGSPTTAGEGFVLDGLDLNDGANYSLIEELPIQPPGKRQEWIQGTDADGAVLLRKPLREIRQIPVRIRISPQASMDAALALIGAIESKLSEAEENVDGIPLVWTPAGSANPLTLYVLSGEFTEGPTVNQKDWYRLKPIIAFRLDCKPEMYGAEVTNAVTVTSSDPVILVTVPDVTGDLPAPARVVITDAATQNRRYVEIGRAWRHTPPSVLIDSDSLVTAGFAGTGTTRTGAYDPGGAGNSVIRGTLTTTPVAICGTGNLSHLGSFRVKVHVYPVIGTADAADMKIRLSWKEGDGPLRSNAWASPVAGTAAWSGVDLGMISIPEKLLGTQRWTGQIEAYSATAGDTLDIDYIELFPTEQYGKARAPVVYETVTTFTARDEFDQTAGALDTKALPVGGTWATSGAGTDLAVETTGHTVERTTSDSTTRYAVPSLAASTAQLVQMDYKTSAVFTPTAFLLGRWADSSNHLQVLFNSGAGQVVTVIARVAGTPTFLQPTDPPTPLTLADTWYTLRLLVEASGYWAIWAFPRGGNPGEPLAQGVSSVLATGGALASGKTGFADYSGAAGTRSYDNFITATPGDRAVVFSGQSAEIRYDSAIREDSTGTYWGPVPSYLGAHIYLDPAGDENRPNTFAIKVRRNDIDVLPDDQIADSTAIAVHYMPCWSTVPY